MGKNKTLGDRLMEAFGTSDKEFIAKTLGFASKQGLYKVLDGSRELDYEKLRNFREYTKRRIDWLLTGEQDQGISISGASEAKLAAIAHEQSITVFADAEVTGPSLDEKTLGLLVEYLLNDAMMTHHLITKPAMNAADWNRAKRFTFVSEREKSIEEKFRDIVREELAELQHRDHHVEIEDANMILAPVVARIAGGEEKKRKAS